MPRRGLRSHGVSTFSAGGTGRSGFTTGGDGDGIGTSSGSTVGTRRAYLVHHDGAEDAPSVPGTPVRPGAGRIGPVLCLPGGPAGALPGPGRRRTVDGRGAGGRGGGERSVRAGMAGAAGHERRPGGGGAARHGRRASLRPAPRP